MTDPQRAAGDFVQLMLGSQNRLYAFILTLVCDPEQAGDVLQETNVVLWEKADQFELGTNFTAWAFRIARYQVMAHRQRLGRDRHVFDDEAVGVLAIEFDRQSDGFDDRQKALAQCLKMLPKDAQKLISQRYASNQSVRQIAESLEQSANRVAVRLHRLRVTLMECIRRKRPEGEPT